MRLSIFLLLALQAFSIVTKAQNITGNIVNNKNEAVVNATISLLYAKDSSLIKTAVSNEKGKFIFTNSDTLPLLVNVTAIGYQTKYIQLNNRLDVVVVMDAATTALNEVMVISKKQVIEVRPDKVVFNIENAVNAIGTNGLELLRKSPGVVVDNNDNIVLLGNNVAVYIDNKPTPLTGKDLADFLRTLQGTDIATIEIIKNPSAKMDAAGTGGIINIKLKKNKNYGTNGAVNLGYATGIYGKYNTGASLNYRNKKVNIFGNISTNNGINASYTKFYREQGDSIYDQNTNSRSKYNGRHIKAGVDYFINKKNTIGFLASVFLDGRDDKSNAATPIKSLDTKIPSRILIANNTSKGNKVNTAFNINHHYTDTTGRELNTDVDYGTYTTSNNNYQPNQYRSPDMQRVLEEKNYNIITNRSIRLLTFKSDYEQNFMGGKLSFGVKASFVNTKNNFNFSDVLNDKTITDSSRSNNFELTENIYAAYTNYAIQLKKWNIQAGVRAEQTNTNGILKSTVAQADKNIKRSYLNFFPSAGVSYHLNDKNGFNVNYSRRIERPGYQDLNPFESKIDELSYQKGNPFLKPEYTNSFSVTHTCNYNLNTTIGYSKTADFSTQITDTTEGQRNFIQQRNAGTQQNFYINISYPFNVAKWWNVYANAGANHLTNHVNLGPGYISNLTSNNFSIYTQHTFTLPKQYIIEVSGFYNSPSLWGGTFLNRSFWGADAGIQKRFLQEKATVKLSVSDIFNSMHWRGISHFGGLYMDAAGGWESRQLKINFSYRFGHKEIKKERTRATSSEDINKRL